MSTVFVNSHLGRAVAFRLPGERQLVIYGTNRPLVGLEMGQLPIGAAYTQEVDQDDWAYVKKTYADLEPLKNGLIYASSDRASAAKQAAEKSELRHGFEPVESASVKVKPAKAGK